MTRLFRLIISDAQILKSIKNGDDRVLEYLYEKNERMINSYICDNNGTIADASEALQDALVIFWENVRRDKFELKSKISTYLYAVVKNRWLQEIARRRKHTDLSGQEVAQQQTDIPEESFDQEELSDIVKRCMKQLADLCRKILTFYYYEDKSMAEISKLVGLANENVAKAKKYQCKKELEFLVRKATQ